MKINKDKEAKLTIDALKDRLHYNPDTGLFTNKRTTGRAVKGRIAGQVTADGYIRITINGLVFPAHRLAYLYMVGKFPPDIIDHIDRDKTNNRWHNIMASNTRQNAHNTDNNNSFVGVHWHVQRGGWVARAVEDGVSKHLGIFKTHLSACYARHQFNIKSNFSA